MPSKTKATSRRHDERRERVALSRRRTSASPSVTQARRSAPALGTGDAIVSLAARHIGETYVLGARAPMGNANWTGPWDCAEFASWCVYQTSGVLFGVRPNNDAMMADAYTGYWAQDGAGANACTVEAAAAIPGAMLLRVPGSQGSGGHIAISDGEGGTIEAHGSDRGVIAHQVSGRRWDHGVLVPGIVYGMSDEPVSVTPASPSNVLRLTRPATRGDHVLALQQRLAELGYFPGSLDGIFGAQTQHAVIAFQNASGLVPDGEVGPLTRAALELE